MDQWGEMRSGIAEKTSWQVFIVQELPAGNLQRYIDLNNNIIIINKKAESEMVALAGNCDVEYNISELEN